MKTNINITKKAARNMRNEYLAMMAEVERRRDEYYQVKAQIHAAENDVLREMYTTLDAIVKASGKMPTAAQLTAAMDGKMSRHEVVGQLTVALNEHYNGTGKTKKATHEPTQDAKGKVKADYKQVRRSFVEVDESGKVVPNGAIITKEDRVKVYGVRG